MDVHNLANPSKLTPHGKHGGEIFSQTDSCSPTQIVDFSTNVNDLARPEIFQPAILNAMHQIPQYPDSKSTFLRQVLRNFLERGLNERNFIVGAGSMELITTFCDMFLQHGQ